MTAIRTSPPAPGEQPTWSEHWAAVTGEWGMAAREVCQLNDRTQAVVTTYLAWVVGTAQPLEPPWWHSELDWERLAQDLGQGLVPLSSAEKALARIAVGLVAGRGEFEYQALDAAGYLDEVLEVIAACSRLLRAPHP